MPKIGPGEKPYALVLRKEKWDRVKIRAIQCGETVREFLERLIDAELAKAAPPAGKAKPR